MFDDRLFFKLLGLSALMLFVSVYTHEQAHAWAARLLGFRAEAHYHVTVIDYRPLYDSLQVYYSRYHRQVTSPRPSALKTRYHRFRMAANRRMNAVTAAGPLYTMTAGTLGLVLLWLRRRRSLPEADFYRPDWLLASVALFWMRQVVLLGFWAFEHLLPLPRMLFGDEFSLSRYLGWPDWSLTLVTGLAGGAVWIAVLRLVPPHQRSTFFWATVLGYLLGWFAWFRLFGPLLVG